MKFNFNHSLKKTIPLLYILCISSTLALAQFTNSWIDYSTNHQYFKFPVYKTGVYKLDSSTLANAGFPVGSVSPQKLQLYARGKEIPLHITGVQDGILNKLDAIEFYATKNSGDMDTAIYLTKGGNAYISLFNDTIFYFLTWSTSALNGARYAVDSTTNYSSYTPQPYWYKQLVLANAYTYALGSYRVNATDYGYYAEEGYATLAVNDTINAAQTIINTPNMVLNAPVYSSHAYMSGSSSGSNDNHLKLSFNNIVLSDDLFSGYAYFKKNNSFNSSLLNNNNTLTFKSLSTNSVNTGRAFLAYFTLSYPAATVVNNKANYEFYSMPNSASVIRFDIAQQAGTLSNTRIINTYASTLTVPNYSTGNCIALLQQQGATSNHYVVYNTDSAELVTTILKINGTGYFTNYATPLINNEIILLTHPKLLLAAQQYSSYRSSKGRINTVVNINDVYDQFGYGVNKSPVAIQEFVKYAKQVSTTNNYLFIIGKGLTSETSRVNATHYANNLIPTFGEPPSDVSLVTPNILTKLTPLMHVGRLAAKTPNEVNNYLAKLIEYETNTQPGKYTDDGQWMKQALHFAGGRDATQANLFKQYLDEYKDTLENIYYGGKVSTYAKSTSLPIGQVSEVIKQQINDGVSIMTFFAHASGSGFDQDIGQPADYTNNNGKYPVFIANSCFVGNIHNENNNSFSEAWVLSSKGAVGFVAEPSLGFPGPLADYSRKLYSQIARANYSGTLGLSMSNTISYLTDTNITHGFVKDIRNVAVAMTLHGDPSLIINSPTKPDLALRNNATSILPAVVTTANDTFILKTDAFNFGKTVLTPVTVTVEHYYQGSTLPDTIYTKIIPNGVNYITPLSFGIKINATKGIGLNHFVIKIDPLDIITPEQTEINNTISIDVNILNSDVYPVYPSNYAIVPTNKIVLKAATGLPLEPVANYVFECDTTDTFNSPLLQTNTISSAGGVMEWNINNLTLIDTTVYFWRVARVTGAALKWKKQSFEYIPLKTGWGQAHFYQFEDDKYQYIDALRATRKYKFTTKPVNLICTVSGNSAFANKYQLDTDLKEYNGCGNNPQIHVAVIDTNDFEPWGTRFGSSNPTHNFGNYNDNGACRNRVENAFMYNVNSPTQMVALQNLLQTVPQGFYILLYTYVNGNFNAWPTSLKNYVSGLGGTFVNSIPDDFPYIFFVKKGDASTAKQVLPVNNKYEYLTLTQPLYNDWYYGSITSTTIGPVSKWNSLHWNSHSVDTALYNDEVDIKLFAQLPNGQEKQVMHTFKPNEKNVLLTDSIDAMQYPILTLRVFTKDSITRTPTQMNYWRIYYDPLPEGVINPNKNYSYTNSTTQEGDSISLQVAFTNVTNVPMDSVLVRYWWQDPTGKTFATNNNTPQAFSYKRNAALPANAYINLGIKIPTIGKAGSNTLWLEANPISDQAEQFHFNNYLALPFKINKDNQNPLLDVTFDGQHILNGDIVAPSPLIELQVKDENKYLLLNDTSNVTISLKRPNTNAYERLYYNNNGSYTMRFVPAQNSANKARVLLQANGLTDGVYTLSAQSVDKSNNRSGSGAYEVSFEIINKSTLTQVLNYPNPFSTNTKFVYTLTGAALPDVFKIQIMTVTGKVIRELNVNELGPIHVGRNISATGWDGTDMYGDQLANGLYLYHIIAKINGQDIELRESLADGYFKKGWGKMYLLR
jgi:hypothetical protein